MGKAMPCNARNVKEHRLFSIKNKVMIILPTLITNNELGGVLG